MTESTPPPPSAPSEVEKPVRAATDGDDGFGFARQGVSTSLDTNGIKGTYRKFGLLVALLVFVADQASKWVVTYPLGLQRQGVLYVLPFFDLRWVENRGVSMGFLTAGTDAARWLLVAMTAAIAIGVFIWMWREKAKWDTVALALVLGGALGNIVDRTRYGFVVDFADLHFGTWRPFLIFNVADAAITIGVLLLILRAFLTREKKDV